MYENKPCLHEGILIHLAHHPKWRNNINKHTAYLCWQLARIANAGGDYESAKHEVIDFYLKAACQYVQEGRNAYGTN